MDCFKVSDTVWLNFAILIILVFLFTTPNSSDAKPSKIRSYKILEGENLLVICNATDSLDTDVYWTKNATKSTFKQEGKRLEILNIKRSYSGDYICHSLNTSYPVPEYNETDVNVTVEVVNVDVQYPAEIDYFSVGPYELLENETFSITCDLQANPNPVWTIRNRDNNLRFMEATGPARATLTSPPATCEYTGYWECTGYNAFSYGVNVTRGHNITVYCPPKPQYGQNRFDVRAEVGQSTQLVMKLRANPRAEYTWTKDDGTDISNITKQEDFNNETILTFRNMSVPYFGNYTLKMKNKYGSYYAHYQITTNGYPETPKNLRFSDVTSNSVKLQWTSGFDMGSRQHFIVVRIGENNNIYELPGRIYDNSTNHGIEQNWTYVYVGLASDTYYNISILSENERGYRSNYASPTAVFRTRKDPYNVKSSETQVTLIVGLTLGSVGVVGVLAFIVYLVKYRRLRTSYTVMDEKPTKF